ncbi:MAG: hypothetical protein ACK5MT_03560 [Actinomycetales bacterium]
MPSYTTTLSTRQERVAAELLDGLRPRLIQIASTTAHLVQAVTELCERSGMNVSMDQISGRCTSAAAVLIGNGTSPSHDTLQELALQVTAKVAAIFPHLSPGEFDDQYAQEYDQQWQSYGAINLATFPPSRLLVGSDQRPPLLPKRGTRETDAHGTDRSVYGRYTSYRPVPDHDPVPFRSKAARCVQPVTRRSKSRNIGLEEVQRACMPYGLNEDFHRRVLRGIHDGMQFDANQPYTPEADTDLARKCVLLHDEQYISDGVRLLIHKRLANLRDRPETGLNLDGFHWEVDLTSPSLYAGHVDRVTQVLIRRTWKAAHNLEMYVEERMCSCCLHAVVSTTFDRAVPTLLATWDDSAWSRPEHAPENDRSAPSREIEALITAQNETSHLLATQDAQIATRLLMLRPGWRTEYEALIAHDRARYLPTEEFSKWCEDMVPGAYDQDASPEVEGQ